MAYNRHIKNYWQSDDKVVNLNILAEKEEFEVQLT